VIAQTRKNGKAPFSYLGVCRDRKHNIEKEREKRKERGKRDTQSL
jgi:hypothetical protein